MSPRDGAGFTLAELTVVLVLVGALAVVAVPMLRTGAADEAAFAAELRTALRYAQRLAVNAGCPVRVRLDGAADALALHYPDGTTAGACGPADPPAFSPGVPVPDLRGGGPYRRQATGGAGLAADAAVHFDALGRPSAALAVAVGPHAVQVEPETGYVH
jgi:prepilin-type N-terminal cleavage/methylation domain-containing protein